MQSESHKTVNGMTTRAGETCRQGNRSSPADRDPLKTKTPRSFKQRLPDTGAQPTWREALKAWPQYPLPHHLLSRCLGRIVRWRWKPWKNLLIRGFIRHYRVDMSLAAAPDPGAYRHFGEFFARPLRPGARPPDSEGVLSPVDGSISRIGYASESELLQAKGRRYRLEELLPEGRAAPFRGGAYATFYLSPRDYHRVHIPIDGELRERRYVPGRLFSVNPAATRLIPRLYARNERLALMFDTPAGEMAVVMVGALFVGGLETVWDAPAGPPPASGETSQRLARGQELGRFNMGSSVILLFPRDRIRWHASLHAGDPVRVGQSLGTLTETSSTLVKPETAFG